MLQSHGDDRGFVEGGPSEGSRAWGVVDYETGMVTLTVNASCGTGVSDCHDALPINSDSSLVSSYAEYLPFVADTNKVNIGVGDDGTINLVLHIKNSDKVTMAPRIDARITFAPNEAANTMKVSWDRDPFPMLEIYRLNGQQPAATVLQDPSGGIAAMSLLPVAPNHQGNTSLVLVTT